jgi:predicted lipid carrier protein YhbT
MNSNSKVLPAPCLGRYTAIVDGPIITRSAVLVATLSQVLASTLQDDKLTFLKGRAMPVWKSDANLEFRASLPGNKLRVAKGLTKRTQIAL